MTTLPVQKLYIGGEYVDATSGETFQTVNPATGEVICEIQIASEADVDRAVESARAGQKIWAAMTGAERGRILNKAVALLREHNDELAKLEVLDTGKPIQEADCVDVVSGADCIEYFAGVAASIHGDHYDLGSAFAYTRREPLGVCAGIGAWNYPIQIACWKSGPALACGNAMVYKPSEMTPLTALKLAEIYTEAGVPAGVFNVVNGFGPVGAAMTMHKDIEKVSLTGSVPTGKKIIQGAAETLKHVTLELGGKSPLIIFADSNLDNAVSAALMANFYTQGEICSNGTRVFVEESIKDAFLDKLVSRTKAMKIGDPMDPETHVGSLISADHMDKVLGYIEAGKAEGATLVTGGGRYLENDCDKGSFVEPTIFTDCREGMKIVEEEIFGPVMSVLTFTSEEEVIKRANDTEMGLAAGVFTKDIQRGHRVVAQLQAGTCWINNYNITPIEMPFGGYKQSGIGRENSLAAIEHYTQIKSVYVELGDVEAPY
ncbi:betaine-aldehyde dehydrogenase [Aestuariispira insulae]|uniref:Betaine aldehyde dehydrogenase n=1 Tax=Aestuariispira insulae TaxID=1461337 RepID=A0A3D9HLS2_9PROT|nr:betaine-aldehyde dehydrogenase [Aestuariispira insulae]RED49846.1 betaine aldehyde dehydrogenase [Aestuariispira insulae]